MVQGRSERLRNLRESSTSAIRQGPARLCLERSCQHRGRDGVARLPRFSGIGKHDDTQFFPRERDDLAVEQQRSAAVVSDGPGAPYVDVTEARQHPSESGVQIEVQNNVAVLDRQHLIECPGPDDPAPVGPSAREHHAQEAGQVNCAGA